MHGSEASYDAADPGRGVANAGHICGKDLISAGQDGYRRKRSCGVNLALIQARMGSSRFPGKVLEDLWGRPMLWHVVNRVRKAKRVGKVVVATTDLAVDDPIAR